MLAVQKFLLDFGQQKLVDDYSIKIKTVNNLSIYNYDQIESSHVKYETITRECRGLILDDNFNIVARGFNRFFNLGECEKEDTRFNWDDFECQEKLDGSLMFLWCLDGNWTVSTRGSFGDARPGDFDITFAELFWRNFDASKLDNMNPACTFVFELVGPYNKVVREYVEGLYLTGVFYNHINEELCAEYVEGIAEWLGVMSPARYQVTQKNVLRMLDFIAEGDPTFEGFVLRDVNNVRIKVKSKEYLLLHTLKGNGSIISPKRFVPIYCKGEVDEIVATFPEYANALRTYESYLDSISRECCDRYLSVKDIPDQRDFALAIADFPWRAILFQARKLGVSPGEQFLKSESLLINLLKESKIGSGVG